MSQTTAAGTAESSAATQYDGPCQSRDSIADIWGPRTPFRGEGQWPARCDIEIEDTPDKWVQSACILCSNGCACDIGVKDGKIVGVRGRVEDRVNKGRMGPKGLHGWRANNAPDRLKTPLIRKNGQLVEATWDEAMDLIVRSTQAVQQRYSAGGMAIYSTGQLFLEEYYTLAVLGKGGLGVHHMDGNTRLCTATAAASFRESFGADGQPASYADIDTTDCLFMVGHNVAATQTVLWARILDRLAGPNPPTLIVVDPRVTATAKEATIHLRPRVGTNLALLNGIQRLLFKNGYVDRAWVEAHTVGCRELETVVEQYTREKTEEITGVPVAQLLETARVLGSTPTLVSTALQGVYQSHLATASACAINNIHLLRGLIGKPGCGPLQMNGQPTAQNNRESGCNGEFTAFRNYANPRHMEDLATHWNVDLSIIPHWHVPTHIMEIMKHIEAGTIHMLWVVCTNPAVSLPELQRARKILSKPGLFLVVQDAFMTETAASADVVLPAAIWGEKTGCFTNADRTVHISHKAVEPPALARSDFDIFCDYARRLGLKDKDGQPLIKWSTPEQCFEAWKAVTAGCPCDYTGMSYAKLTGGSGVQWPCNDKYPDGCPRLYSDARFPTEQEDCESYGHDLVTGAAMSVHEYALLAPRGRAILKAAEWSKPLESPDEEYPLWVTTGRNVYHFHTRTKTGRARALHAAAPDAYVEIHPEDAARFGVSEDGVMVRVTTRQGHITVAAKITASVEQGTLFVPFHWGYFDADGRHRAANELTRPGWDPVSKQPYFKFATGKLEPATHAMAQPAPEGRVAGLLHSVAAAVLPEKLSGTGEGVGKGLPSAAPAGGDVVAQQPGQVDGVEQAQRAVGAAGESAATMAPHPADNLQHMDAPAMSAPPGKTNASDFLSLHFQDIRARAYMGEQVYLLAAQVQQLHEVLEFMRASLQTEQEIQQAVTTFFSFYPEMTSKVQCLQQRHCGIRNQRPSYEVKIGYTPDPNNAAMAAIFAIQRLGAVCDAIGMSVITLQIAGQAARDADTQAESDSVGQFSARIHRWCVSQLKAKASQALAVPV